MKSLTRRSILLCSSTNSSSQSCSPSQFNDSCSLLFNLSTTDESPQRRRFQPSLLFYSSIPFRSYSSSSWRHHHDENSRNVKASVWWDMENCAVPSGVNVARVAQRITSALRANGVNGPIAITAFGDIFQLSRASQEALLASGISLNHVPHAEPVTDFHYSFALEKEFRGLTNILRRLRMNNSLLVDLVSWVSLNPPPAHLFLISGDQDFANILHRLRMNNYNILLASNDSAPGILCSAASIMWQWNSLLKGEELNGKYFNQPPDGPRGSWYGYYKGPLEDPFAVTWPSDNSQVEESLEPGMESKPRPIPKAFVNRISQIVNSHPKGINIIELRSELLRANIYMDKDFFGYKKFSHLLLALANVLKLSVTEGQILVHSIQTKPAEPVEVDLRLLSDSENSKVNASSGQITELGTKSNATIANVNRKPILPKPLPSKEKPLFVTLKQNGSSGSCENSNNNPADSASDGSLDKQQYSLSVESKGQHHNAISSSSCENGNNNPAGSASDGNLDKQQSILYVESKGQNHNAISSSSFSPSLVDSSLADKITSEFEKEDMDSKPRVGFFGRIKLWFGAWRTGKSGDSPVGKCDKEVNTKDVQTVSQVFSKSAFWNEIESFLRAHKGSALISQSKTRELLAQEIQKEGLAICNTLSFDDLLQLVDLLISEKKWVVETPSQTFPFKLNFPITQSPISSDPHKSNALSSMFSRTLLDQRPPDQKDGNGEQKLIQNGTSSIASNRKFSSRSKTKVLADCKKLVSETTKLHPEGFNMGAFKRLFLERYGYALDHHMLGFPKLAALLQTFPGVKIEGVFIFAVGNTPPTPRWENDLPYCQEGNTPGKACLDNGLSDSARKDNDSDSVWEELGPVSKKNASTSVFASGSNEKVIGKPQCSLSRDSYLLDSDSSDSDGESPIRDLSEEQYKLMKKDEDSSLVQILDSWYSGKDGKGSKFQHSKADGLGGSSRDDDSPKTNLNRTALVSVGECKTKPRKVYSFVSDEVDEKDKLIDSILGSLRKPSDESKLQN
ncbi:hypothetical protein Sjap_018565 [Stephania japonica]|uniref:HTH OST-type domain-containing protein n=1 Tax=Stephania japonica TaxID=461633 RepID=A0AAP0I8C7_9MAGN